MPFLKGTLTNTEYFENEENQIFMALFLAFFFFTFLYFHLVLNSSCGFNIMNKSRLAFVDHCVLFL